MGIGKHIDAALRYVFPGWAERRDSARATRIYTDTMDKYMSRFSSSYKGAQSNRLRRSWVPGGGSADEDILWDLPAIRERSRDLVRNDGHAASAVNTTVINTVGTGLKPQSRLKANRLNISKERAREISRQFEDVFSDWARWADAGNRMNYWDIQRLVDRQMLVNGEILLLPLRVDRQQTRFKLALQPIEADRLETPGGITSKDGVRSGVKIGNIGQPLGYYIRKTHPGDITYSKSRKIDDYQYVTAFNQFGDHNIFHLYAVQRPGQSRGVPFFAPVLNYFKDKSEYLEAELVAERIAACYGLIVKRMDPYSAGTSPSRTTNSKGQRIDSIEPGMVEYLLPGEEIETINPSRTSDTFDPFMTLVLRTIGAALELPYELLAKDFSKTTYTSGRMALIQAYRYFESREQFLNMHLNQFIYEMVLEEAYLNGELDIDDFLTNKKEYVRTKWIGQGRKMVDPLKEIKAEQIAKDEQLVPMADLSANRGSDWEADLEQIAAEQEYKEELGLIESTDLSPNGADKNISTKSSENTMTIRSEA